MKKILFSALLLMSFVITSNTFAASLTIMGTASLVAQDGLHFTMECVKSEFECVCIDLNTGRIDINWPSYRQTGTLTNLEENPSENVNATVEFEADSE